MPKSEKAGQTGERPNQEWPAGVELRHTLRGHPSVIRRIAWSPDGTKLAAPSGPAVYVWDTETGNLQHVLTGNEETVYCAAWSPDGRIIASGSGDGRIILWQADNGTNLQSLHLHKGWVNALAWHPSRLLASGSEDMRISVWDPETAELKYSSAEHRGNVNALAWSPDGRTLASASGDSTVKLWDAEKGSCHHTLYGHDNWAFSLAWSPDSNTLLSASLDTTIREWSAHTGRQLHVLEQHVTPVSSVSLSHDGRLFATKSKADLIMLWNRDTWELVAQLDEPRSPRFSPSIAFHPVAPRLATLGERDTVIRIWDIDMARLLQVESSQKPVYHTTAKIVLVGDHSVGKSGLGWRLAHGEFKEQLATHGQKFWLLPQLGKLRDDGTECEAILWDLAGQPDYRLIHALFLNDVDLALVLFDSSNLSDPLHGVEYWLNHLKVGQTSGQAGADNKHVGCPTILVGAQADRGTPRLTLEELEAFCHRRGISGYLSTSALTGLGLDELVERMKELVAWDAKPATVTTATFKRIKDYVLKLKESLEGQPVIVNPPELRRQLERTDAGWEFSDAEMMTAVGHLENYGYVKRLRTSKGEERVLLAPELLNNLASSFILEARRNPGGLGSLEEKRLMEGGYSFPELEKLPPAERDILLDAAALLFLEHNVCFRETDPLGGQSYLVFPELINLKKPLEDEQLTTDGVAYTVSGAVENVYASLVVLLGYTRAFTRTNQWQDQARYVMANGSICGFRQESNREGELELVLYYGVDVPKPGQKVFEGLFESFLARRNVTVFRYEPVFCPSGHTINRAVVRERLRGGKDFAFCAECGEKAVLQKAEEPIQLTQTERSKVDEQRWIAAQRTRFEQAVFQVMSYVKDRDVKAPECFISYAWGDQELERWVERNLASDLQKAGINVVLDRWENDRAGKSVSRFVSRIAECDRVIPVGTPLYLQKFENKVSSTGSVVAAEVGLISQRLMGTEEDKETVMPVLLAGEKKTSLPPLMWDQVYRDFRTGRAYFVTAFDFILDLYGIAHNDKAVADLRESLRESEMR